jgi:hypothetical protein
VKRPFYFRAWFLGLLALGGVAAALSFTRADEPLRLSRNVAGDSKPVLVDADEIITWVDGKYRIVVLKGQVLVQQGVVEARFDQGVVRIDLEKYEKQHILHVDLFADGNVKLANGSDKSEGGKAVVDLNTRGEFKLNAHKNKIVQQAKPDDPVYKRLLGSLSAPSDKAPAKSTKSDPAKPGAPSNPIQQTSYQEIPRTPPPVPPVKPAQRPVPPPDPPPSTTEPLPELPPLPPGPAPPGPTAATPGAPDLPPPDVPDPPPPTRGRGPSTVVPILPGQTPLATGNPVRQFTVTPRTAAGFKGPYARVINGERVVVVLGGVIVTVTGGPNNETLDIEADSLIVWSQGGAPVDALSLSSPDAKSTRELEFYLAGNVEIREQTGKDIRTLRADEVYYDINRHVAIAVGADLQFRQPNVPIPIHLRADELMELSATQFQAVSAEVSASKTPADPGLKVVFANATLEEQKVPRTSIFGMTFTNTVTGQPETEVQQIVHGDNVFLKLEDVPVFYLPYVQGDANDPLGPIRSVNVGYNRVFGGQFGVSLNMFDLLAITPRPGLRWVLDADYLTRRGPALGSNFDYSGVNPFGMTGRYDGHLALLGMYDQGTDILGGGRGQFDNHPLWRGSVQWAQNVLDLPLGFVVQSQVGVFSDHNFYEQYHKMPFDTYINQETYLYVKQQRDNWAWTFLTEQRIRNWVTETDQLPGVDGYLIGQSFFDLLTYNAHASAGYYHLEPSSAPPPAFSPTDRSDQTGRFDLFQELSLPFYLGPVKTVPYAVLDLTQYTNDLAGDSVGRVYGGGGLAMSMPLTRIYPDVQSELFNLNQINHKIVLTGNFYAAETNEPFFKFPQLDRLNDDATDQAIRQIRPIEPAINPSNGLFLATSPIFDPQLYAIRNLVMNRVDTLGDMEVLQLDLRQRLQTKRGYPGMEHITDWMTLDLSASIFPRSNRDNFGESFGLFQYDYLWNVGDRTALMSSGWFEPENNAARVFTIGAALNRPDRTNYFIGFRSIEPVGSQALTAAITYIFSEKYAMTASALYDFGTNQALSESLIFTRTGSDLTVSFSMSYNATTNSFGVDLIILPNLVATGKRFAGLVGVPGFGAGSMLAR